MVNEVAVCYRKRAIPCHIYFILLFFGDDQSQDGNVYDIIDYDCLRRPTHPHPHPHPPDKMAAISQRIFS